MSSASSIQATPVLTPLQRSRLVDGTKAEERAESPSQKAAELVKPEPARQAGGPARGVDVFA